MRFREATSADFAAIAASRAQDPDAGPADDRTGRYLAGEHHPGHALDARVGYVALKVYGDSIQGGAEVVAGYIAGHLSTRFGCDGELQYLWVDPAYRRTGLASTLLAMLAQWFADHDARSVCVDVVPENQRARAFYAAHGASPLNPNWLVFHDITTLVPPKEQTQ